MARRPDLRDPPLWIAAFGLGLIAIALWNTTDEAFCSSWCGNLTAPIFQLLYSVFGHWGPRGFLVATGVIFITATLFFRAYDNFNRRR